MVNTKIMGLKDIETRYKPISKDDAFKIAKHSALVYFGHHKKGDYNFNYISSVVKGIRDTIGIKGNITIGDLLDLRNEVEFELSRKRRFKE